jgi:hypothetical protein
MGSSYPDLLGKDTVSPILGLVLVIFCMRVQLSRLMKTDGPAHSLGGG